MNTQTLVNLFVFYDGYLEGQNVKAIKSEHTDLPYRSDPISFEHLRWMCQEAQKIELNSHEGWGKLNRWLGFIQGYLWMEDFSIDEMREHNSCEETEEVQ